MVMSQEMQIFTQFGATGGGLIGEFLLACLRAKIVPHKHRGKSHSFAHFCGKNADRLQSKVS